MALSSESSKADIGVIGALSIVMVGLWAADSSQPSGSLHLINVVTCVAGLWLLFVVLRSMIRVGLMNRHYEDLYAQLIGHTEHGVVAWRLRGKHDNKSAHPVLLWIFPAYGRVIVMETLT